MNKREVCNLGTVRSVHFPEFYYINQPKNKELVKQLFISMALLLVSALNTLRRRLYLMGLINNSTCRKCGAYEETSVHILCECESLTSLRHSYYPQHTILNHHQPTFLPQRERPSFTPIQKTCRINSSVSYIWLLNLTKIGVGCKYKQK